MSWWSSVVDKAVKVATTALTYTVNTGIQSLNQVLAMPEAAVALINKPESRKILNGMVYVVKNDVLPVVGVNFINNAVQTYFRQSVASSPEITTAYTVFLGGLTLADYAVRAYTWRQGAEALVHITTLDVLGPLAFKNDSERSRLEPAVKPSSDDPVWQGKLREPIILAANDGLVWAINRVPYVGPYLARAARVSFNGRYIARLSTSNLSEANKLPLMMQEAIISLGLTYEMSSWLMDWVLERTVGMPPYLYYRTMKHLLLLLHVNVAAHMVIPRMKEEDLTLPIDPFTVYESASRFFFNVVLAGLMVRVPLDFKFDPKAEPLIPLNSALQNATKLLKSDLERENTLAPNSNKFMIKVRDLTVPAVFRDIINDPILRMYWPAVQNGATENLKLVRKYGHGRTTAALAWSPQGVALAVYYIFGIPESITVELLKLTKEKDVWDFIEALEAWFERHGVKKETVLTNAQDDRVTPLGGGKLIAVEPQVATPLSSADALITQRNDSRPVTDANALISRRDAQQSLPSQALKGPDNVLTFRRPVSNTTTANHPSSFFSARPGRVPVSVVETEESANAM